MTSGPSVCMAATLTPDGLACSLQHLKTSSLTARTPCSLLLPTLASVSPGVRAQYGIWHTKEELHNQRSVQNENAEPCSNIIRNFKRATARH